MKCKQILSVLSPESGKFLNLAHYFQYDVKLRLLAHSRSFLANQKAINAIVGAENLLKLDSRLYYNHACPQHHVNSHNKKWALGQSEC